jgi:hypothetical protein
VSYTFEVRGETVWDPALRIGLIHHGYVEVLERVLGRPAGWTMVAGDTVEIDPRVFTTFVDGLLDAYGRSNHPVLHGQLALVIKLSLVMLERAGAPWQPDDPRLEPVKDYRDVGRSMPV